jgi:beta-lactamase class A
MNPTSFYAQLETLLQDFEGTFGLCVRPLEEGVVPTLEWNATESFPAASTIKVPILIAALQQAENGALELGERFALEDSDKVGGAGILHELGPGLNLSLQDWLTLMMVVSDNTATNKVIEQVGQDRINTLLERYPSTELVGKLQLPLEKQNERQRRGERNRTNPRDLARMVLELHHGLLLEPEMTALALNILEKQQYKDMVGRALPRDSSGELAVRVLSKSGEISGTRNDVALVYGPIPYSIALMTKGGRDLREHPENEMVVLGARVSRLVWDTLDTL